MNYRAVIFDLDGTLIDSMQLWREVDTEFLGKRQILIPEDLFDHLPAGNSFIQTADYFKQRFGLPDSVESIMQEWTDMVKSHYESSVELKIGAREILEALRERGIKIGLGTSNSLELSQKVLTHHGIWDYFVSVVTGDMQLMGKPFPDIYLKSAANLKVAPADCLVIEDTITGVEAGKAAGMTVFAIYDADSDAQRQRIVQTADRHFESFAEIRHALELN